VLQSPHPEQAANAVEGIDMLKNNTLAIALASLLVGGVAVAAFQNSRSHADTATATMPAADAALAAGDAAATDSSIPSGGKVE